MAPRSSTISSNSIAREPASSQIFSWSEEMVFGALLIMVLAMPWSRSRSLRKESPTHSARRST